MKKILTRCLIILLVVIMISTLSCALAENQSKADTSVNAYADLFNALCDFEGGKDSFDDWFAGGTLDDEGTLTLFIKAEDSYQLELLFNCYCFKVPDLAKIAHPSCVKYSLNDLLHFEEITTDAIEAAEIMSCGIDYQANKLCIGCRETSPLFDSFDLKIPKDSYSLFVENESVTLTALHGGDSIITSATTLGWCGTYNGSPAIVTCGHGNYVSSTISIQDDNYVNNTATRAFDSINNLSGTSRLGDFYIATVGTGLTTNKIHTGSSGTLASCGSYLSSVPQGTNLYYWGKITKQFRGSTIQAYTYYVIYSESIAYNVIYGLVKAYPQAPNYTIPAPGDSGGPVYYTYDGGGIGATGTITGYDNNGYILFSPLKYAVNYGFTVRTW